MDEDFGYTVVIIVFGHVKSESLLSYENIMRRDVVMVDVIKFACVFFSALLDIVEWREDTSV